MAPTISSRLASLALLGVALLEVALLNGLYSTLLLLLAGRHEPVHADGWAGASTTGTELQDLVANLDGSDGYSVSVSISELFPDIKPGDERLKIFENMKDNPETVRMVQRMLEEKSKKEGLSKVVLESNKEPGKKVTLHNPKIELRADGTLRESRPKDEDLAEERRMYTISVYTGDRCVRRARVERTQRTHCTAPLTAPTLSVRTDDPPARTTTGRSRERTRGRGSTWSTRTGWSGGSTFRASSSAAPRASSTCTRTSSSA